VGIIAYDSRPTGALPPISSPRRWTELVNEPYGLAYVCYFTARHGKPLSLPEWGSVTPPQGGDDGAYVAHVGRFVTTHNVAYQAWFDAPSNRVLQLDPTTACCRRDWMRLLRQDCPKTIWHDCSRTRVGAGRWPEPATGAR